MCDEKRIAPIGVIVRIDAVEEMNHSASRLPRTYNRQDGDPHPEKNFRSSVSLLSPIRHDQCAVGKLGALDGVSTKTVYSKK